MKCNIVRHGPVCLHRFLDQRASNVPECSHKGSDVWGAQAAMEPVRLLRQRRKSPTRPQCSVGHSGLTGLSLSGEEEDGGVWRAHWQAAEQFIHVGLTEV